MSRMSAARDLLPPVCSSTHRMCWRSFSSNVAMGEVIKVLVVDDEERFRNTLGKLLTAQGMTVTIADGDRKSVV